MNSSHQSSVKIIVDYLALCSCAHCGVFVCMSTFVMQQDLNLSSQCLCSVSVPSLQEDSSDLKCQLHFAKEESALMCKKLTKLVKDSEAMKEELAKYRSLYGDVDASLTVEEVRNTHSLWSGFI